MAAVRPTAQGGRELRPEAQRRLQPGRAGRAAPPQGRTADCCHRGWNRVRRWTWRAEEDPCRARLEEAPPGAAAPITTHRLMDFCQSQKDAGGAHRRVLPTHGSISRALLLPPRVPQGVGLLRWTAAADKPHLPRTSAKAAPLPFVSGAPICGPSRAPTCPVLPGAAAPFAIRTEGTWAALEVPLPHPRTGAAGFGYPCWGEKGTLYMLSDTLPAIITSPVSCWTACFGLFPPWSSAVLSKAAPKVVWESLGLVDGVSPGPASLTCWSPLRRSTGRWTEAIQSQTSKEVLTKSHPEASCANLSLARGACFC